MTQFDDSWKALTAPGQATSFFEPPLGASRFDCSPRFSLQTAWWLMELSRLVYRNEPRDPFLRNVGFREVAFHRCKGFHCAIVVSEGEPRQPDVAMLVFRGTDEPQNWIANINARPISWSAGNGLCAVHRGFAEALDCIWEEAAKTLDSLNPSLPLFYTGHSLGAALATLAAARRKPRAAYTFGCPLVGDVALAKVIGDTPLFRIVNGRDKVTTVPIPLPPLFDYAHCGELHVIGGRRTHSAIGYVPDSWADHAPVNYVAQLERELGV